MKSLVFSTSILLCLGVALAQNREHAFDVNERLGRGINYGNMLEAPTEEEWGNPWQPEYPQIIAELGFDHVRIPIRWEPDDRSSSTAPYTIDPQFMARVKEVVDATLAEGLMAIINMHHHEALYDDPEGQKERFLAMWTQIGETFKDYPDDLLFEILNEPHGNLSTDLWNVFVLDALAAIRSSNPDRVVLIGTADYGGLGGLSALELPDDEDIILTIHYYNPFQFTHQGADWVDGDSESWLGTTWDDTDIERLVIQGEFAGLIDRSSKENVPVHIGEFGAYSTADIDSRERWTTYLGRYFEELGWSWAYWEFSAGFGIYNPDNQSYIDPLVDALLHNEMPEPTVVERNTLYEWNISDGVSQWSLNAFEGASAQLSAQDDGMRISISESGSESWHIQLTRGNVILTNGKQYLFSFKGYADGDRSLTWYVGMSQDPWSAYSSYSTAGLNEFSGSFLTNFTMNRTDETARIAFDMGLQDVDVVITEVKMEEIVSDEPLLWLSESATVRVYPNPVFETVSVEVEQTGFVRLFDLEGRLVFDKELELGKNELILTALKSDIYVLSIEQADRRISYKLIKN